jgi:hypothetical protein
LALDTTTSSSASHVLHNASNLTTSTSASSYADHSQYEAGANNTTNFAANLSNLTFLVTTVTTTPIRDVVIPGLSNPSACCRRMGHTGVIQLLFVLGTALAEPGVYTMCWGFAKASLPQQNASEFPVVLGALSLHGPKPLGHVHCSLGVPCLLTLYGFGLSVVDSIVLHTGTDCTWPEVLPFPIADACAGDGSDHYVLAEVAGGERVFVGTTCADPAIEGAFCFLRSYIMPALPRIVPLLSAADIPHGPIGVTSAEFMYEPL